MNKQLWIWALVVAMLPALQGCFPLVATGVVGTGLVVADRRTSGAQLEDEGIELRAGHAVTEKYGDKAHINFTSYNRILLLTGEVPDQEVRSGVEAIARATSNVRSVINETAVAGNSSLSERTTDAYLTTKVRTRLMSEASGRFWPVHISITSEAGVVYLMGLVTRAEGDAASGIASTTSGVRRVVKVFEYIPRVPDDERPKPVEPAKPADVQPPAPQIEVLPPAKPVSM